MASAHPEPSAGEPAPARPDRGEVARYLGALSLVVVGVIHAQQYYYDYFSVVPTIGTLFVLSFVGSGVVAAVLIAPVRRLGRNIGDVILALAALSGSASRPGRW